MPGGQAQAGRERQGGEKCCDACDFQRLFQVCFGIPLKKQERPLKEV